MPKPVNVSDETFEEEVLQSDVPVLVDFWAAWCGPCRIIAPILEEIAEEKGKSLKVAKVNVDENMRVAMQLGISSIPTLILYKNGQPVERIIGAQPKQRLLQQIEKHLS